MTDEAYSLKLADGTCLSLRALDEVSARILAFFARAAGLTPGVPAPDGKARRLLVVTGAAEHQPPGERICRLEPFDPQPVPFKHRILAPMTEDQWFWRQLARLSSGIAHETQARGGFLLHSALALAPQDRGQTAFLLAGRSGVGKSTASRRLPPPWRSLCDDVTLIVRDDAGHYWAHPWPTWSRFFGAEAGDGSDCWNVQQPARLGAIFILEQAALDTIAPVGAGHAVAMLAELASQTSQYYLRGQSLEEIAAFHSQRFENICALARALPAYQLSVSLEGKFWEKLPL